MATFLRGSCVMTGELSTHPLKSQELSREAIAPRHDRKKQGTKLRFFWLVLSALVWGGPIIVFLYIPLRILEKLLQTQSPVKHFLHRTRQRIFTRGIHAYLCMQDFYSVDYDLKHLRETENSQQKFILVSNHRSHLDVFLFLSQIEGLQLLAKKSLFSVPLLGSMMRLTQQIPAEKHDWKSLDEAKNNIEMRISHGAKVLIFPEFKRCEPGLQHINAYSSLPFQIAKKENLLIVPIVITGTDEVWPKSSLAIRKPKNNIHVHALPAIDPSNFTSIKELKDKTHELSLKKFEALKQGETWT